MSKRKFYGTSHPATKAITAQLNCWAYNKEEKIMNADNFQNFACEKWFGNKDNTDETYLVVPVLGLVGEAGEVAEKMKKFFRGDNDIMPREAIALEISDVLFYAAILSDRLGFSLEEIMQMQVDKINGRIERGTRRGEGDNR